ncbi:MAG: uroporphyrinogen-III C-methyltransferase [Arenicella sp.]|nr:uroporphyrinogen-III C-methyltransferase [Arenicella sp.]
MTEIEKPNESEEVTPTKVAASPTAGGAADAQPPVVVKSAGKGLAFVAILFSIAALGVTGFSLYKTEIEGRDDDAKLAVKIAEIGGNISRLGDTVSRLQRAQRNVVSKEQLTTRLLQSSNSVDLQFRDVKQSQNELLSAVTKLNSDLSSGINDFVISEVSQLLKLANNSALFSSDSRSAIKALQLADIQLKEMADPRYSIVRRKINEEISLLESIEQVDIESVTVKLKGLADRIPSLKLENDVPVLGDVVVKTEQKAQGFKAQLKEMWADIVNYNSVQRIDQAPKPLLLPEQRYFLNQNIQLQLAKAELGLVQNRASVYLASLELASDWLNEYFDLGDDAVTDVLSQINQLKAMSLSTELPTISGSYSLLQSIRGGQ